MLQALHEERPKSPNSETSKKFVAVRFSGVSILLLNLDASQEFVDKCLGNSIYGDAYRNACALQELAACTLHFAHKLHSMHQN